MIRKIIHLDMDVLLLPLNWVICLNERKNRRWLVQAR